MSTPIEDLFSNIAKDDQSKAASEDLGKLLGNYRANLIAAGITEDIANAMLLDYHWIIMNKNLFPEGPFPYRS